MRSKITCVVALCLLTSSSLQAGSWCPYHWWLGLVALSEGVIALYPEYRREIRIAEIVAVMGVAGYAVKTALNKASKKEESTTTE